jgi:hypothetical protein
MAIYECNGCDQYAEHFECQECFNDSRCQYCYVCDEGCDHLTDEEIQAHETKGTPMQLNIEDLKTLEALKRYVDNNLAGATIEFDAQGLLKINTHLTATASGNLVKFPFDENALQQISREAQELLGSI